MESTRQNKIERLIQKELGQMFIKMTNTYHGTIVSVTSVKVSSDLGIANVRVSIFPQNKVEETMEILKNSVKGIRYELGTHVHNQLRIIPELRFFRDDSIDYIENIDRLLGLNKNAAPVNAETEKTDKKEGEEEAK